MVFVWNFSGMLLWRQRFRQLTVSKSVAKLIGVVVSNWRLASASYRWRSGARLERRARYLGRLLCGLRAPGNAARPAHPVGASAINIRQADVAKTSAMSSRRYDHGRPVLCFMSSCRDGVSRCLQRPVTSGLETRSIAVACRIVLGDRL